MSFLEQLWDDTVAGPRPENGLGKLRKNSTFNFRPSFGKESDGGSTEDGVRVTRSIMIVKPPQGANQNGSPPVSPAGSTPPVSPFAVEYACCYVKGAGFSAMDQKTLTSIPLRGKEGHS